MRFLFFVLAALLSGIACAQQLNNANFSGTVTDSTGVVHGIVGGGVVTIRGETKPYMLISGWSFPIQSLKVAGSLPHGLTIRISGYDKDKKMLLATDDSFVPQGEPPQDKPIEYFTQAANVIWEFTKTGITFETDDGVFVTEKDGATIQFDKDGVHLDGIRRSDAGTTAPSAASQPSGILAPFVGRWIDDDNKDQFLVIDAAEIRWRGEVIPVSSCTGADDGQGLSFPMPASAGAVVNGKMVRGTQTCKMVIDHNILTITEDESSEVKDNSSGFGFTVAPAKYTFKKVPAGP